MKKISKHKVDEKAKEYQAKHKVSKRKAEFEVLNEIFDDLPDGAYFAAMEEHGFDIEEIVELSEVKEEVHGAIQ